MQDGHSLGFLALHGLALEARVPQPFHTSGVQSTFLLLEEFLNSCTDRSGDYLYLAMPGTCQNLINIQQSINRPVLTSFELSKFKHFNNYAEYGWLSDVNIAQLLRPINEITDHYHLFVPSDFAIFERGQWYFQAATTGANHLETLARSRNFKFPPSKIIGVLHANGNHWHTFLYSVTTGVLEVFDSLQPEEPPHLKKLEQVLQAYCQIFALPWMGWQRQLNSSTPQQTNSHDCRLYAVLAAYCLATSKELLYGPVDLSSARSILFAMKARIPFPSIQRNVNAVEQVTTQAQTAADIQDCLACQSLTPCVRASLLEHLKSLNQKADLILQNVQVQEQQL